MHCLWNMNKSRNGNVLSTFLQPKNASVSPFGPFYRPKDRFLYLSYTSACGITLLSYWPDARKRYPFREVPSGTAHYWECPLGPRSTRPLYQVPVLQKLDYFIQRVNHYPTDKLSIRETDCVIRWIEIYLVDSVIHLLNNWAGLSLQETRTEKEEQIDVLGEDFFITIRN